MACNCGNGKAGKGDMVHRFAVVEDILLANEPNLIPEEDKFLTIAEAQLHVVPGKYIVAITEILTA